MIKHKLYLVCGAPASGKSTWIQNHLKNFEPKVEVISRDQIRFSLLKDNDDYFSQENEVWRQFVNKAKKSLDKNTNTILDATHLNENSRRKILRALGSSLKNIEVNIIYFDIPLEICLERNSMREGLAYVPETAIRNMFKSKTFPRFEEGFDTIYVINQNGKIITMKEVKN